MTFFPLSFSGLDEHLHFNYLNHFREYCGPSNQLQSDFSLIDKPRDPWSSVYTFPENAVALDGLKSPNFERAAWSLTVSENEAKMPISSLRLSFAVREVEGEADSAAGIATLEAAAGLDDHTNSPVK